MYAVIFRAKTDKIDEQYAIMVESMRDLAFNKYGCLNFVAVTEGNEEIAISYWSDEASILQWKQDSQHSIAQSLGREKWYESYTVQIVEVKREYGFDKLDKESC